MRVITKKIELKTKGNPDLINITPILKQTLEVSGLREGSLTVFVSGSTAAVTTFEYEPGLIRDMQEIYEKIASSSKHYHHDDTWGDANGFSHIRSALQGPSLTIPFEKGTLLLGTWQQVVLAEFDNHPRKREIVLQMMGE
ncbi:MAG: secondary thiamine-phosphate synthase enzyme YjbQ [Candidatus Omnitrophica bacterium]|nr:secondary thiamine-phosphate synthase enzyme YjbQ [Candidatus Omnitrophota bacterium]